MVSQQYDTGEQPSPAERALPGALPAYGLIWVLLVGLGWLGLVLAGPFGYQRQSVQLDGPSIAVRPGVAQPFSEQLRGDLWLPARPTGALPAVILVHGVMSSRLQPELAARSLSRAGLAVLCFDLRGYGESDPGPDTPEAHRQDVLSALAFLRAQPGIDPHRIALVGHSMGATAVIDASSEDGQVPATYAMGMHGDGKARWLTGLYDNLHPPGLYREVIVSPSANHQTEWNDLWLLTRLQRELEAEFRLPAAPGPWPELLRSWSGILLALGLLGVLAQLLVPLTAYLRLGLLSAAGGGLLLATGFGWLDAGLSAIAIILMLLAYILCQIPPARLRGLAWLGLGLFAARELAAVLRVLPSIQPIWLPLHLWQSLCHFPLSLSHGLRALLFARSQTQLEASWVLMALAAAEWLFPGWWLKSGWRPKRSQGPMLAALAAGLLVLGGLLWTRLQQGYLEPEGLNHLLKVLLGEVPTVVLLAIGYGLYRRNKRPRDDSNIRPTV